MSKVAIDFSDVKGFEAIPAGRYEVNIDKIELMPSKSSEHEQLVWSLSVVEEEYINRKLWLRTSLSPKSKWVIKNIFETFGIDASGEIEMEVDDETKMLLDPALIGLHAHAVVSQEEYQNKVRNRVDDLIGLGTPVAAGESFR